MHMFSERMQICLFVYLYSTVLYNQVAQSASQYHNKIYKKHKYHNNMDMI